MSPRTGRPKLENPKNKQLRVRLNDEENTILEEYCEQEGVTKAEAARCGIRKLKADIKKEKE